MASLAETTVTAHRRTAACADELTQPSPEQRQAATIVPTLQSAVDDGAVTFDQLFEAYYGQGAPLQPHQKQTTADERAAYRTLYPLLRQRFERASPVDSEYWCRTLPAAVALVGSTSGLGLLSIVDWEQDDEPIVEQLNLLDQLVIGAEQLRVGADRRTTFKLIFNAYSSALDALENRRLYPGRNNADELKLLLQQVEMARTYYRAAAERKAYGDYWAGMLASYVVLVIILALTAFATQGTGTDQLGLPAVPLLAAGAAGGLGAIVSVMTRITRNDLKLNADASQYSLRVVGAMRPLVGATFGVALSVLSLSGLVGLNPPSLPQQASAFYLGLAFLAGFSERWAQDLLSRQPSALGATAAERAETSRSKPRA